MTLDAKLKAGQAPPAGGPRRGRAGLSVPRRYSAVGLWVFFIVLFGILQFHLFLTVSTVQVVFSQGAVTALLALAALVPLTTDTYDLSIGETMSLGIVMMTWFGANTHLPFALTVVIVVAVSCCIGWVSGFIVVRFRVNSLIATLGMSQLLSAAQLYISQNREIPGNFSQAVLNLGNGKLWGIPYLDIYLLVIAVVAWFVLEQTPLGRRMLAVGGNSEAARLAGIKSDRIRWGTLVVSGGIAGFAGVLYSVQVGAYTSDIGSGYLFPALAAVFFGASQLSQRPNVWGTIIAYFALAFGVQGLTLQFGAGAFWVSPLFQGAALIIAVALANSRGAIGNGRDGRMLRRFRRPAVEEEASQP
ncbi:MAG TPA: ABC transporter permease [Trebonia sp.]|nr:ABC transporter permease [Trebonia sp.]